MFLVLIDSLFLFLLLALFALQRPETLFAVALLSGVYGVARSRPSLLDNRGVMLVSLSMFVLVMVVVVRGSQQASSFFYLLSGVCALYSAKRFASFSMAHVRRCLQVAFWLSVLGIACGLFVYWGVPEPMGEIIPGSSTNGLPSYLIVLQLAVSIAVFLERGRLPLLSAVATFVVAMLGVGRGSIIVSLVILVSSLLGNIWLSIEGCRWRIFYRSMLLAVLVVAVMVVYFLLDATELSGFFSQTKWAWGLVDPPRAEMVSDYLSGLDALSVLVGGSFIGTSIDDLYGGNPHNSFIRIHSLFGLPGFLLIFLFPLMIVMSNRKVRNRFVVAALVLLALIRAITEPILFPTALDFFYFLYFFMFWKYAAIR